MFMPFDSATHLCKILKVHVQFALSGLAVSQLVRLFSACYIEFEGPYVFKCKCS